MNCSECVKLLIHYSANVNIQDKSGSTPLHLCCAYGIPELIPLLLESGSHLNIFDKEDKTPLDLAEEKIDIDSYMACAVLLRRHLNLFQSEEISKYATNPIDFLDNMNHFNKYSSPPSPTQHQLGVDQTNSKQKPKPFIAGSTLGVSRWEWDRILSVYTETSSTKTHSKYLLNSNSSPHSTLPVSTHSRELQSNDYQIINSMTSQQNQQYQQNHQQQNKIQLGSSRSQTFLEETNSNNLISTSIPHYLLPVHSPSQQTFPISPSANLTSSPPSSHQLPSTKSKQNKGINKKILKPKFQLFIPFQPVSAKPFDVFLSVEMCSDCHLHNWSLWHNEDRYNGAANECLRVIIHDLLRNVPKIRLFAYKTKVPPEKTERIGALEVGLTIKIPKKSYNNQQQRDSWVEKLIFSKLKTKRFIFILIFNSILLIFS